MSDDAVDRDDMFQDEPMLGGFARDLRQAAASAPDLAIGPALAAVLDGAAAPPPSPVPVPSAAPGRRGRLPLGMGLRLGIAAGLATIGLVVVAASGDLPAPVQRHVARLASAIGIELPGGSDAGAPSEDEGGPPPVGTTEPADPRTRLPTTSSSVDPAIAPDDRGVDLVTGDDGNAGHGDDDDGQDESNPGRGKGPPAAPPSTVPAARPDGRRPGPDGAGAADDAPGAPGDRAGGDDRRPPGRRDGN